MCRFSGTEDSEYRKVAAAIEKVLTEKISRKFFSKEWFRTILRVVVNGH